MTSPNDNIVTTDSGENAARYFHDSFVRPGTEQFHQFQLRAKDSPNHCGPFSAAMALNMVMGETLITGEQIAKSLTRHFVEWRPGESLLPRLNRFPPRAFTFPGAIVNFLRRDGLWAQLHINGSIGQLRASALSGRVPVVLLGEPLRFSGLRWVGWSHWKTVVGFTPTQFLFQDPLYEKPEPTAQDIAEFDRQWRNMLRFWVDVGRKTAE